MFSGSVFSFEKICAEQGEVYVSDGGVTNFAEPNLSSETPVRANQLWSTLRYFLLLFLLTSASQPVVAQQSPSVSYLDETPITTEQVVQNLAEMNHHRLEALQAYEGRRTYRVEYRGVTGNRTAEMVVHVRYQAPGTKEFTIQSATGSKLIIDKVFKKLMEAEKEALTGDSQSRTALISENYSFTMVGNESTPSGSAYVLAVEPKRKDMFLYRGRIWVNAEDFAVVRLEAEPAKNPSFWTKRAQIEQLYTKVSDFWLPASNRSVTSIRLGGRAELTIIHHDYQITSAGPVGSLSKLATTRTAENHRSLSPDAR